MREESRGRSRSGGGPLGGMGGKAQTKGGVPPSDLDPRELTYSGKRCKIPTSTKWKINCCSCLFLFAGGGGSNMSCFDVRARALCAPAPGSGSDEQGFVQLQLLKTPVEGSAVKTVSHVGR